MTMDTHPRRIGRASAWLLPLSLALAGCAYQASSAASTVTQQPSLAQSPRAMTFEIEPMGLATDLSGTVVVETGAGGYTLSLTVEGLQPGAHYPVNLHHGACPLPDTTWDSWLDQSVEADARGTLLLEKAYTKPWDVPAEGLTLTVHGAVPNSAREHIGCADLTD